VQGLGNSQSEFEHRRLNARPNFVYLTSEFKQLWELPWDMRIAARVTGQIASTPLISNEQFAVGGPQSVRGYHQTQQLGDDGINLSFEWQSPQLKPVSWDFVQNLRAHWFFDYAHLWIQDVLAPSPSVYRLAGAGMGFRLQMYRHWQGEFDWAYPLERQGSVDVGNQRVDFKLAYEF